MQEIKGCWNFSRGFAGQKRCLAERRLGPQIIVDSTADAVWCGVGLREGFEPVAVSLKQRRGW